MQSTAGIISVYCARCMTSSLSACKCPRVFEESCCGTFASSTLERTQNPEVSSVAICVEGVRRPRMLPVTKSQGSHESTNMDYYHPRGMPFWRKADPVYQHSQYRLSLTKSLMIETILLDRHVPSLRRCFNRFRDVPKSAGHRPLPLCRHELCSSIQGYLSNSRLTN
jgi:hypothetical protein